MKILICVVCFPDPVIFSFVFCIIVVCFDLFATLFLLISGDMADRFASAPVYMGMILLVASAFAPLFGAFAGISRLFFNVWGYPGLYFLSFGFDASLIPAGESAHKPGTGRRIWEG